MCSQSAKYPLTMRFYIHKQLFFVEQTCCPKFQSPDIRALDIHNAINMFHARLLYAKDSGWICRILFSNMCNLG